MNHTLASLYINNDTVDKNSHKDKKEKWKAYFKKKKFIFILTSIFSKYFICHIEYQGTKIPIIEKRL